MRIHPFVRNGLLIGFAMVSTISFSTAARTPLERFRLVKSDGDSLPAYDDANGICTVAGWYHVQDNRWRSVDSLKSPNCESNSIDIIADSGLLVRHRDTLSFFSKHAKGAEAYLVQRGVLRGDSLLAGAFYFDGPAVVYIRVH